MSFKRGSTEFTLSTATTDIFLEWEFDKSYTKKCPQSHLLKQQVYISGCICLAATTNHTRCQTNGNTHPTAQDKTGKHDPDLTSEECVPIILLTATQAKGILFVIKIPDANNTCFDYSASVEKYSPPVLSCVVGCVFPSVWHLVRIVFAAKQMRPLMPKHVLFAAGF